MFRRAQRQPITPPRRKHFVFLTLLCAVAVNLMGPRFANAGRQRHIAGRPPLVYERSNGGPGFSAHERITLKADGSVVYETSGPLDFEWTTQNRAGEFATQV